MHAIARLLRGAVELALPAMCPACDARTPDDEPLCEVCARTVEAIGAACPRCALPAARSVAPTTPGPTEAPRCLGCALAQPPWSRARAPLAYAGQLAVAVRRWKLGGEPARTAPLAALLRPSLRRFTDVDAFVPVPLHPRRLRARGFNQASLLIRAARGKGDPLVEELLDRVRDTPPQSSLDARVRRDNVRGAFAAPRPARVRGRRVALVDDVLTTGATAAECARVLYRAGAADVAVLTLARTLP